MNRDILVYQLPPGMLGLEVVLFSDISSLDHLAEQVATPHRHDHYCCFFLESGALDFRIDFEQLAIRDSSLLISTPGQVHQLKQAQDVKGWFMAFDAALIDPEARRIIEQSFAKVALLQLNVAEKQWFISVFQLIDAALKAQDSSSFHHQLIHTLMNAFFYKTAAIFQLQETERIREYSSRSIEIAKTFHQLVKANFAAIKKPSDYASRMNITVSYLNDTVKSVTGFPSTWLIQNEIFREAQRLLFYTEKSVREIATQLGYEDDKYFIRLFRKTKGSSPAVFRKNSKSYGL